MHQLVAANFAKFFKQRFQTKNFEAARRLLRWFAYLLKLVNV